SAPPAFAPPVPAVGGAWRALGCGLAPGRGASERCCAVTAASVSAAFRRNRPVRCGPFLPGGAGNRIGSPAKNRATADDRIVSRLDWRPVAAVAGGGYLCSTQYC